jgi:AcrR family transcriptional regulator
MGTLERKARHRGHLRRRILEAARELFTARGYGAVTLRAVAERIEYSPTAIYGYFPDKQSLVQALCEEDWRHFAGNFRRAEEEPSPLPRLLGIGDALVRFALAHPNQYRFLFVSGEPDAEGSEPAPRSAAGQEVYGPVRAAVVEAIGAGVFPAHPHDEADLIASAFCLAMHGVAAMHVNGGGVPAGNRREPGETITFVVNAIFRGIS